MTMKRSLTTRYLAALLAIVCVLVSSYLMVQHEIDNNEDDAHLINVSGRQRMLSQRIALLTREVQLGTDRLAALEAARSEMQTAHRSLLDHHWPSEGPEQVSEALTTMYRSDGGVDEEVTTYLAAVDTFIEAAMTDGPASPSATLAADQVATLSQAGLLDHLDAIVHQYERQNEAKTRRFRRIETVVLFLGLCLLAIEALFLFRPMVGMVDRALHSLERANEELRHFAYRVSHDLRAPVASSLGLTRVASSMLDAGNTDHTREALRLIEGAMVRMDAHVSQVIDYTSDRDSTEPARPIELQAFIESVIDDMRHIPGFTRVNVDLECSVEQPILVQPVLLRHTLENLISNAVKYQDPSEPEPQLHVGAQLRGHTCSVAVTDNGLGVPNEHREDLFGMFKRFHPQAASGTGLGLYLVQQNARMLGGGVRYEPQPKGSRFVLDFTVRPSLPAAP